jgi:cysteine desulfurase
MAKGDFLLLPQTKIGVDKMHRIYFDHSATTPVNPEVASLMMEFMTEKYGNPSSIHLWGKQARQAISEAREKVALLIGATPNEIYFTSGGTEADNLALIGYALANEKKGNHIITSSIEHHAVLHTCEFLEQQGFEITYLPVDELGMVSGSDLKKTIKDNTILVSIMFANNEVGTIQPVAEIGAICRQNGVRFHTDAVGAIGSYPIDVNELNIDLLTISGHKINAPKGTGALYIRKGINVQPLLHGGAHEHNMRAGTENVPGIVGLGEACSIARREMNNKIAHLTMLRKKIIRTVLSTIPDTRLNGHTSQRVPGNINLSFKYIEGESLILNLDLKGIATSSGSACSSGALNPSHVLLAMGLTHEEAHGSLRITLGHSNTEEEIDYFLDVLPEIVFKLRSMSPLLNRNT